MCIKNRTRVLQAPLCWKIAPPLLNYTILIKVPLPNFVFCQREAFLLSSHLQLLVLGGSFKITKGIKSIKKHFCCLLHKFVCLFVSFNPVVACYCWVTRLLYHIAIDLICIYRIDFYLCDNCEFVCVLCMHRNGSCSGSFRQYLKHIKIVIISTP